MQDENPFTDLEPIRDAPMDPATVISALAMNFALKHHQNTVVRDGAMYTALKADGQQLVPLNLALVLDTALEIERHLLGAPSRVAQIIIDGEALLTGAPADETNADEPPETAP